MELEYLGGWDLSQNEGNKKSSFEERMGDSDISFVHEGCRDLRGCFHQAVEYGGLDSGGLGCLLGAPEGRKCGPGQHAD